MARAARRVERWLVPYHRARVLGLDRIPPGPAIYVGNHNGGSYTGDTYLLGAAVLRDRGLADVPWALTHDLAVRLLGRWLRPLGAVPADPATAGALLARGDKVLTYPGGDADGARSWWRRHEVVFAGRTGFARLAVRHGVPVVPVAAAGAHSTWMVLSDGAAVARRLRTARWLRLQRWPLALCLPWGIAFLPSFPYLPWPARITVAVGAPLRFTRSGAEAAADDAYVRTCAAATEAAVQTLLDDLLDGAHRDGRGRGRRDRGMRDTRGDRARGAPGRFGRGPRAQAAKGVHAWRP